MKRSCLAGAVLTCLSLSVPMANAQTWTPLTNQPNFSASMAVLMTDGSILAQAYLTENWYKFTPDAFGSYVNGTWSQLTSTPGYAPLFYSSQVLADGRVLIMGGEYNGVGSGFTNLGYIYNPKTNSWAFQAPPTGWSNIGDASSIVLPNGKVMLGNPLNNQCAIFDPATNSFGAPFTSGKADDNDEETWTLLPSGNVLCVDTNPTGANTKGSEIFNTTTLQWSSAGTTPVDLVDSGSKELGPGILTPDGKVFSFGGTQHNAIFDSTTATWSTAPDFPKNGSDQLACADAPAVLLPSGNILVETSPGVFGNGSTYLEWNGSAFISAPATPDAANGTCFQGSFLILPTGQIFHVHQTNDVEIYTPSGTANPNWAPTITTYPTSVRVSFSYQISGTQFNGLSGGSSYGDDKQSQTNYPMIRIRNNATGHVVYCREFNPSTFKVATGSQIVSTNFAVPALTELGASTIQVVTNGIASIAQPITVLPAAQASSVSMYQGTYVSGKVSDVWLVDGSVYSGKSVNSPVGQQVAFEADFTFPSSNISGLNVSASAAAKLGITGMLYAFNFQTNQFDFLGATNLSTTQKQWSAKASGDASRYVNSSTGLVRVIVRGVVPPRLTAVPYQMNVDAIQVSGG